MDRFADKADVRRSYARRQCGCNRALVVAGRVVTHYSFFILAGWIDFVLSMNV